MSSTLVSPWQLTNGQRDQLVLRIRNCYQSLQFVKDSFLQSDDRIDAVARGIEKQAYMTAQVESRTTTGVRPTEEIMRAYVRKISELVLDALKQQQSQKHSFENGLGCSSLPKFRIDDQGRFDISGVENRGFIDEDQAKELFAPLMQQNNGVRSIKLSDRSFDVGAAEVAARALLNCVDTLEEADLSDIVPGRPEDVGLQVYEKFSDSLAKCKKLIKLDLSDNAMGEKGFRQFKSVLQAQRKLQELKVRNIGMSPETCEAVSELVASNKLKSLVMINNMSGDEGALALVPLVKRNPQLTTFVMNSSRVQEEGCQAILNALSYCPDLVTFEISDNSLTEESAHPLLSFLESHPLLERVNVSYTMLGEKGINSFVHCIQNGGLKNIREFYIRGEDYTETEDEFLKLFAVLASCKNLEILDVGENVLESKGVILLCQALEKFQGPLQILKLTDNSLGRLGAVSAVKCIVEILQKKQVFKQLVLNENQICEEGIMEINQILLDAGLNKEIVTMENNESEDVEEEDEEELDLHTAGQQLTLHFEKLGIK
eukprot:TRINITY_DN12664_c0_g1_i1.p1 TRINITY_DN12664_c0_g1~~TRINITY_DN12664_c0_g1_i1.p1  ORF type:complete len:544 (-),score=116.95 TRINITY_DN12664_c0_g1_i1:83-1714(-)